MEVANSIFSTLFFLFRYAHFLPDSEFPLLKMKHPSKVGDQHYFAETRLKIGSNTSLGKKCMVCGNTLPAGPVISSHDPDRNPNRGLPRQINFLPPRPPYLTLRPDPDNRLVKIDIILRMNLLKIKSWHGHSSAEKWEIYYHLKVEKYIFRENSK